MYFYLQCLVVFSAIFIVCAVISESVFNSASERVLGHDVRISLSYFFLLSFFAIVMRFLPAQWGWYIGIPILTLYLFLKKDLKFYSRIKGSREIYFFSYFRFLVLINIFFLPLHMSRTYGPFTEGGGDVSIYADTTKLVVDRNEAVWGVDDFIFQIKKIFGGETANTKQYSQFNDTLFNPPTAEYGAYRVVSTQGWSSVLFSPVAQWSFLSPDSNYAVFYTILAFQYAIVLLSIFVFFKTFGKTAQYLALILAMASHGLISVFYNVYFLQSASIGVTTLILAILPEIRVFSPEGFRCYLSTIGVPAVGYPHFLALIAPLLTTRFEGLRVFLQRSKRDAWACLSRVYIVPLVWTSGMLLWIGLGIGALVPEWTYIIGKLVGSLFSAKGNGNVFQGSSSYGDAVPLFTLKWWAFFWGPLSQQHFQPFVVETNTVQKFTAASVYLGLAIAIMGLFIIIRRLRQHDITNSNYRQYYWLYFCALFSVFIMTIAGQSTMYTQAKCAQNSLTIIYTLILVLPLAMSEKYLRTNKVYKGLLLLFIGCMAVPRLDFLNRLAHSEDRSAILGNSYFEASKLVLAHDDKPIVLFEPRKSADLYLGIQPFFGQKFIPTRHLSYQRSHFDVKKTYAAQWSREDGLIASDFFSVTDVDHLWLLSSKTIDPSHGIDKSVWIPERLALIESPRLLLFGNQYEKNTSGPEADYFINFGESFLWLPSNSSRKQEQNIIEVTITPSPPIELEKFQKNPPKFVGVSEKILSGRLVYRFEINSNKSQLISLGKHFDPYLLKVTVNGKAI